MNTSGGGSRLDLLDLLLEREGIESPIRLSIPRRAPGASAPLSFGQQRLFFLDRWSPGNPTYNVNGAFRLAGRLDPAALAAALGEIVRRHESLRTAFTLFEGAPIASIDPPSALPPAAVPTVDLSALAAGLAERAQASALKVRAREPFDLSRAPLLRSLLVRRGGREHALILSVHHIATDGWSMGNLAREMIALYGAFSRRQRSPLADLPIQYADYALWQRAEADSAASHAQLEYWRRRLAGAPPILDLPTDRKRPAEAGAEGASSPVRLAGDLAARLADLGRRERATSFMVLLAGFAALLSRHGAGEDLVIGTPLANRALPETETLIGFLVNMVALRLDLSGDPTFRDLVARAQAEALTAFDHQGLPFERLVEALDLARDASATPVFQVAFVLQNTPEARFELPGLEIEALAAETATAKFDLLLGLREGRGGIGGSLEYRSELFYPATMGRWCERYEILLAAVAEGPEIRLSDLPVLTAAERVELLGSPAEETVSRSLVEAFAAQATLRPDAVAVSSCDFELSYGGLSRRAEAIAVRLRALGVGAEDRVALIAARDSSLVEGIVGILLSGAAYVPLDPAYPETRLRLLVEDSDVRAVVAAPAALEGFPVAALGAVPVVMLDEIDYFKPSEWTASTRPDPAAAAYVIYTSGSTGRPKGVTVSHANVARLFSATAARFGFEATQVWSLFHSFAFDFSVWELWGALLAGGKVAIVPWWTSRSPEAFRDFLAEEDVTHLSQTPSAFRQLIRVDSAASPLSALRAVTFGGEALEVQGLAPWFERYGDRGPALVNMYGITETTVHVTYRRIERSDLKQAGVSAIGVPISDLSVRVLDARGSLAPPGVPGELCVGGRGLARGYLGRGDLTAERFVPDAYSSVPGARLYRSGDLGRRGLDGEFEYLGRIDHQVKVRGFRIELGEVEAALAEHPDLAETVVVARGEEGEARLAAYLVFRSGKSLSIEALRTFLRARLPEHMVPATFMELEALPLTPHGKVDRRALPAPGGARPGLASAFEAPRDEVERQLAAIWATVVGVGTVGIHDNFFALGGDSIRSLKVLSLARDCGLDFSLQDLFRHQTVAELAASLRPGEGAVGKPAVESLPFDLVTMADRSLLPLDVVDAYPLAFLQAGMLYHIDQTSDSPAYHNVDSIYLRGPYDPGRFKEAVDAVVARHPMLRTSFHFTGFSEPLQLVHESADLSVGTDDLSDLPAADQESWIDRLVEREHLRLFDPTQAPLLRLHLARRSAETFQLTLTENHAIFDGWSLHATLRELFERYLALVEGERPEREAPPEIPYREYVRLEREAIRSAEQKKFWRDRLAGWEGGRLPRLPGYPRSGHGPKMRTLSWRVPEELVDALRGTALEAGAPLKSALLAVHAKALGLLWGRDEILTGLASNGRPEARGGDEIRGLFLNMVPLRMALEGGSWTDLIRGAFEAESAILPFRRYPMGMIQNERGDRSLLESAFTYIYFHSVEELVHSGRIEVLDFKRAEQTHFPLATTFTISPVTSRLTLLVDCDTQELSPEQVDPVLGWFERALTAMARTPEARHDDLCLLSDADREQVLFAYNATDRKFEGPGEGGEALLDELVAQRAALVPEALALLDDQGRGLTYAELLACADEVARRLVAAGIGLESRVGVCLDRSMEMAVALLGVLRAGGAWLPLDPSLPFERLAFMVEDADATVLLASYERLELAERLGSGGRGRSVLPVDVKSPPAATGLRPGPLGQAGQAAYGIYTSGSTGRPKGVLVSHRAIVNRLLWMARRFPLVPEDRVAQKTPFSFDASIWELFSPLLAGATAVLADPEGHKDTAYLARFVNEREISVLQLVPSLLGPFLVEPDLSSGRLRRVFCGGEALPADLVRRFHVRLPGVGIHNLYGPTEAAIDAASNSDLEALETAIAPIGFPIDNDRLYVVDPQGNLSPIGVPGELWIAGRGLARGYLGRPDLTAERFVPEPWGRSSEATGGRAYRTGDLARRLPSGEVEFLGRLDRQTKLRGFRIELEEVEAALRLHPQVRAAAVAIRGTEAENRRLVAYFEVRDGEAPTTSDLVSFMAERLPEQMVPAAFVSLAELPRTPGGKLDRKALPEPAAEGDRASEVTLVRSAIEEIVLGLCAQVLEVVRVDIEESFLTLGGHSLQAIQLALRLRQTFHTELRVRHVLQEPSLRSLASTIERNLAIGAGAKDEPLMPLPRDGSTLPLSFAQRSLWALHQMDPAKSAVYHIPMAVRLSGPLDRGLLGRALDELVRRHETLRTVFVTESDEPRQAVLDPHPSTIRYLDLSGVEPEQRPLAIRRETAADQGAPFNLAHGPLFRFSLLRLQEGEHVGLLTFHHIISDGWSTGVLLRELAALYRAFGAGEGSPLPPLPIQYGDFAAWQRASLGEAAIDRQVAYWKERLAGAAAVLDLPGDRPRPPVRSGRGGVVARLLTQVLGTSVGALARSAAATPFMVYLAAFSVLLRHLAGRSDLIVGSDIACRNRLETEGLIGFFVNQLALRVEASDELSFRDLIGRVRECTLGAYSHQDLPFEQVVGALCPARSASYPPIFQVKLNLQNLPASRIEISGLELKPLAFERGVAELDLTLNLVESPVGVQASAEWNADLFDSQRVAGWLEAFEAVLSAACGDPSTVVGDLGREVKRVEQGRRAEAESSLAAARQSLFKSARRASSGGAS